MPQFRAWLASPNGRSVALVAIAVLSGAAIGVVLVPRAPTPRAEDSTPPAVSFLGSPLTLDDEAPKLALARARRFIGSDFTLVLPDGSPRKVKLARVGARLDRVRLDRLVRAARDPNGVLQTRARETGVDPSGVNLPVPVSVDPEVATPFLLLLKDELDRLPADARLDLEKRELVKEVFGRSVDVDRSLLELDRALEAGRAEAKVVFEERKPRRTSQELGGVRFDQVLGFFETPYNPGVDYRARTFNLRLAASKLDGTVLMPGEIFDFNEVVGPRDEANGYKVAPVIAEGELVDGIGGGTCQISGTLHGAVMFAGLEVVERYPHTRPSSYIRLGLDATVVYPTINFRFKNPFDFPVVLHQVVKNGFVRAEVLGPKRPYLVTLLRRIDAVMPYEEVERPEPKLAEGARVLGQRGVPGFKLRKYRILRSGPHAVRERYDDVYPPTTQIVLVGTGEKKDGKRPKEDKHPEYTADELLVLSQGPGVVDAQGAPDMSEQREPGAYGRPGWTEAAGMPYWKDKEDGEDDPNQDAKQGDSKARAAKAKSGAKKRR
jgi:vancomycin resistance protein YoaR